MPHLTFEQGTIHYRTAGPEDSAAPAVVFVHGFLVDASLWTGVADVLADAGVRSYAPTWPLGSHTTAMSPHADQSPRGVARLIVAFLEALDLDDVTLVGNDTGGALCQFALDTDPSRIGRVVLTNCDAFEEFPPGMFATLFKAMRRPAGVRALLEPMRVTAVRHSPAGFGLLVARPLDAQQTLAWVRPCLEDAGVRRDTARFVAAVRPAELVEVGSRLKAFPGDARLVWGAADRFFTVDLARRLAAAFTEATLVEVPGGRTFLPLDEPGLVAGEIVAAGERRAAAA